MGFDKARTLSITARHGNKMWRCFQQHLQSDTETMSSHALRVLITMNRFFRAFGAASFGVFLLGAPASGATTSYSSPERQAFQRMVDAAEDERWTSALSAARSVGSAAALDAYEWMRLQKDGIDDFQRYARWLDGHPDWPSEAQIQVRAERLIGDAGLSPSSVIGFFSRHEPRTGTGATRYAEALVALGQRPQAVEVARDAWLTKDLTRDDEERMLALFGRELQPLHDTRLDNLIWKIRLTAAERHLSRASSDARRLANARIGLLRKKGNVDSLIAAVPAKLQNDPGLAYARMYWRKKEGLRESAEAMMLEASARNGLGRADKWADERVIFVRDALSDGRVTRAYRLAMGHGLSDGKYFAELEWLAGWIALREMKKPRLAVSHFERLFQNVETPVSRARGAFWAAEAARAAGDSNLAAQWYREAAVFPSAFYGQVAATKLDSRSKLNLPPQVAPVHGPCLDDPRVAVGSALAAGGATLPARLFFYDALEDCGTPGEAKALGLHAEGLGAFRISVGMSRKLRRKSIFIPEISHPILALPRVGCKGEPAPERALSLSIARQESGFDPKALSRAGARGVMQVMPGTARLVAPDAGLRYNLALLGSDRNYNAQIGQCYITRLLERFDGSYPMAIAAYNAGPSRINDWIERNGDPRTNEIDAIDWIERIPFRETRNYVQRVLEGMAIYRARLQP